MLWFFPLVVLLGVVFGWPFAAASLVLWLIGYVGVLAIHAVLAGERLLASCSDAKAINDTSWQSFRWKTERRPGVFKATGLSPP
jgi:hypothetical protein